MGSLLLVLVVMLAVPTQPVRMVPEANPFSFPAVTARRTAAGEIRKLLISPTPVRARLRWVEVGETVPAVTEVRETADGTTITVTVHLPDNPDPHSFVGTGTGADGGRFRAAMNIVQQITQFVLEHQGR